MCIRDRLEHIQSELNIDTYAMNWPIGSGKEFKGVYERDHRRIIAFHGGDHGMQAAKITEGSLEDDTFIDVIGDHFFEKLREDSELLDIASTEFDMERVSKGELTPVFFGLSLIHI